MIRPKKHLLGIERPKAAPEPTRHGLHRLDKNERNLPFTDQFLDVIRHKITSDVLSAYPEPWPAYKRLAAMLGRPADCLLFHLGSEQSIKLIFETYIRKGDKILLHAPGFAMYPVYAHLFQAKTEAVNHDENLGFDWDDFLGRIVPGLRMVVLENPNGFLGTAPSIEVIRAAVERAAECGALALVDEAYYLFHRNGADQLLDAYDNLIITRSFSKAFGLAGLRAGYILSQEKNIEHLRSLKPAYELTSFTIVALCALLDQPGEFTSYVEQTREQLTAMKRQFHSLGFAHSESIANFLTVRLGNELAERLRQDLEGHGILLRRPFREETLKDWIRISTAPPPVQNLLFERLRALVETHHG